MNAEDTRMLLRCYRKDLEILQGRIDKLRETCTHKYGDGATAVSDGGTCEACERTIE